MPKLRLKNIYAKDETGKGYKIYEELEIEYQDNGDDEKLAKIVNSHIEGNADRLDTYDALAEDMIISPEGARSQRRYDRCQQKATDRRSRWRIIFENKMGSINEILNMDNDTFLEMKIARNEWIKEVNKQNGK